jgi:glycosyltransferase involved in cell wall biosynthesis
MFAVMKAQRKILISTIQPVTGGVPSMLRFVIDCLREADYEISLVYYEPYSVSPEASVPFYRLLTGKPAIKEGSFYGCRCFGVGCWLPELEFCHNWPNRHWKKLILEHDDHMMVSGSCLASLPFVATHTPFFGWVATDWLGDREQRAQSYPWYRRLIDTFLTKPVVTRLERKIVLSNRLVALSNHTANALKAIGGKSSMLDLLYMPIATEKFRPSKNRKLNFKLGLVARYEDPRKNLLLLLESLAVVVQKYPQAELVLVGDKPSKNTEQTVKRLALQDNIKIIQHIDNDSLPQILSQLDIFVLPSFQEGLCIAALEAMSCGVPVVSTRCGGPENYIVHGENGLFCTLESSSMSDAILQLFADENRHRRYAIAARETVLKEFSLGSQRDLFWKLFNRYLATPIKLN